MDRTTNRSMIARPLMNKILQEQFLNLDHPPPSIPPVTSPSSPYILWLCADEETFMLAANIWSVPSALPIRTTPSGTFKFYVS